MADPDHDRRASSYDILNAFRRLTGTRPRAEPSPPPPPVNPVRALSVGSLPPSSLPSGPESLQRITHVATDSARPHVTGGPPELPRLLEQLHKSRPFAERADAIDQICTVLEEYSLQNVLTLWALASDLVLPDQPDHVAEPGFKLLRSISLDPKLTPVERTIVFDAAAYTRTTRCFQCRLDTISTLTNGGKNIAACESAIVPFLLNALDACFRASRDAFNASRKGSGKRSVDNPLPETDNLGRIFQYATDVCKFNARILTDNDLEQILQRAMHICQNTTQQGDMENCIKLFDTIITYVHVPTNALKPSLEVLCAIHRQIAGLQDQTWNTLSNLFRSHVGQAAIMSLLHTLRDGPSIKNRQSSLYRGTMQVLQLLVLKDGQGDLPKVPMSLIFSALKASIKEPHATQEEFVIDLVNSILAQESMTDALLAEADLTDMLDIVRICAERDEDRFRAQMAGSTENPSALSKDNHVLAQSALENGSARSAKSDTVPSLGGHDEDVGPHADSPAVPSAKFEAVRRVEDNCIFRLLAELDRISNAMDHVQKDAVMELFLHCANRLSDPIAEKMIQYFAEERLLNPSNSRWLEVSHNVAAATLHDATRPNAVRIMAIKTLRDAYDAVEQLCATHIAAQGAAILLDRIELEGDVEVLEALVDFAVDVADKAQLDRFSEVIQLLQGKLDQPRPAAANSSPPWSSSPAFLPRSDQQDRSHCNVIAVAFVRLFIRNFAHAAQKTRILYNAIRGIAGNDKYDSDSRLTALRLLFRLRADSRHALTVNASSEGERIAAELCRTEETAVTTEKTDGSVLNDHARSEDASSGRKISGSSPHASLNRQNGRATTTAGRVSKPIAPLWMYPGPKGLPEEPTSEPSRVVFSHIDASRYPLSDDVHDMEITLWLELIISLLQRPSDWEIYSYVLVHLGPQLSNQALVRSCVVQLQMLRSVLCEQVRNNSFHEPPPHTLLKKADVAVCLYHILTVILSYHEYFGKSEEDDLVKAFLQGIVQWDRTSKWCIHALSVCCFEVPLSVSKSLDTIIQKMSQIVTKPATAVHILEFLTSLARLPELYKNFREEEFKTVFGVCFRYLQHIRDQRSRAAMPNLSQRGHSGLRHSGPARESTTAADSSSKRPHSVEEDLPHYLYSLAFHVVTFWFMALKMEDRAKQIPWITKNLMTVDSSGRHSMEEHGEVIVDIMNMVAYTDRDHTVRNESFSKPGDGEVWKKTWIVNNGLLTIETAARTGVSQVTSRRPCGTRFFMLQPSLVPPPRHQVPITVGLASDAFYSSSYVGILPEDIFQSFYAPLDLANTTVALPDDDMTRRAIATFDRTATIDSYKVGVIYIGEGQTNERDIFMNDIGSPAYTSFVSGLGTLCRLKDAKFNTGGLDTRGDADGEFTYLWRDRCLELVYHITTMMPTDPNDDMTYPNKKRHIGNDFVNIIFNDSGLPYNFDTFPGAFNYVHIVISPESRASFVDRRIDADPDGKDRYYKVQVMSKPGFPDISPAAETKILSGRHIAAYCRLIAINACVFSDVWFQREGGEQISSWRNRLREIKRLRERYGGSITDQQPTSTPASPLGGSQAVSSPPSRDQNGIASPFQRSSIATFITEGTSRSSISSSSHD
ncbi:Tuberous sclerosis 2-like protein [Ascochyta clinopodiicola]|nr:Tuberous sclerosis 2-like protein [Ascochyta clinopodiicola]